MPGVEGPLLIESASGVRLRLSDGRELIDGMSSWWCAIHGYRHPYLDCALRAQLDRVAHVMFGGLTHEPAIELARRLVELTPAPLEHAPSPIPVRSRSRWRSRCACRRRARGGRACSRCAAATTVTPSARCRCATPSTACIICSPPCSPATCLRRVRPAASTQRSISDTAPRCASSSRATARSSRPRSSSRSSRARVACGSIHRPISGCSANCATPTACC